MRFVTLFILALICSGCKSNPGRELLDPGNASHLEKNIPDFYGKSLEAAGLVDVRSLDSTIIVDLKYSSTDNFLEKDVYGTLEKCYLQPDVAAKLVKANKFLNEIDSTLTLLVFDGARPRSIQRKMWEQVKQMQVKQGTYVSNPSKGSLHNFGAAVDLTISDKRGKELDMGTPFDYFGEKSHTDIEPMLLANGELTSAQVENRKLLRKVMRKAGFFGIQPEWWHFNSCTRETAAIKYKIIE